MILVSIFSNNLKEINHVGVDFGAILVSNRPKKTQNQPYNACNSVAGGELSRTINESWIQKNDWDPF